MDVLIPPSFKFLQILSYLVYFMLVFHLPYMGMVLVSSVFSVAYWKKKPQLSHDFIQLVMGKTGIWIIFGVLPALALALLYRMVLFTGGVPIHWYLLKIILLMVSGLVLLSVYRRTANIIAGAGGVLLVVLYCFHFINLMAFLMFPEKWPLQKTMVPFPLFSITPLLQFGGFLMLSLLLTGGAVLFFYYRWTEKQLPEACPHFNLLKYHGYGMVLAGSLLTPPLLFLDLFNLPVYALSISVYVVAALLVVALFFVTVLVVRMLQNYKECRPRYGVTFFVLGLVAFGLMIGRDRILQTNASLETIAVARMDAEKAWEEEVSKREEIYAKTAGVDASKGEEIFNTICSACHSMDQKRLGPPLLTVLPKYVGKENELIAFISNPKKIDPAYTLMPNPGLTTSKIKAVVKFLMGKVK